VRPSSRLRAGIFLFGSLAAASIAYAAASGSIKGRVTGPDGQGMPAVTLQLRNDITGFRADTTSGSDGSYQFFNVPFNPYILHVDAQSFAPVHRAVDVRSAVPLRVDIALTLVTLSESVTVTAEPTSAQLETDSSTSHVDIDKSYIARAPATVASRAMEELITATPGFAKDENGRFHFQGFHSQSEFVIDGQTVSDQTGITFSNSIDPGIAQSLEVIYGNVPAEYGEKIGAVVNLATKSGLGTPLHGELFGGGARYSTYEGGAALGGGSRNFGAYASVNGSWSDRFLDPVNPDNLHNTGNTQRGFLRLDYASDDLKDQLRFTVLAGQTRRDVPNTITQDAAGQDQTVKSRDQNYNLGWTHVLGPKATFDATGFARLSRFELFPSANDTPVTASSDRTLDNYGANAALNWGIDHHDVKIGGVVKRFPIDERFGFGLTDPGLNDPSSPDYNPDLAPYDLTRGARSSRSRAGARGPTRPPTSRTTSITAASPRASACATTTTTCPPPSPSSSRAWGWLTSSRPRARFSAPATTASSSRRSTRTSCSARRKRPPRWCRRW